MGIFFDRKLFDGKNLSFKLHTIKYTKFVTERRQGPTHLETAEGCIDVSDCIVCCHLCPGLGARGLGLSLLHLELKWEGGERVHV